MPQTVRLFNLDVRLKYITWLKLFLVTMSVLLGLRIQVSNTLAVQCWEQGLL